MSATVDTNGGMSLEVHNSFPAQDRGGYRIDGSRHPFVHPTERGHMSVYPEDDVRFHPESWAEDNGTMPGNVLDLEDRLLGKRIASAETRDWKIKDDGKYHYRSTGHGLVLTLDDGTAFAIANTDDCCAYTDLEAFIYHPDKVDNVITSVETENGYTKWHVLADGSDVLELTVGWSCGNPFYYGYGFDFQVVEVA